MPRFLTGDELGSIKSVSYDSDASSTSKLLLKTLHDGTSTGRKRGVQKLAVTKNDPTLLASAHADGTLCFASLTGEDDLEQLWEWKETRFKAADHSFVGLASTHNTVYSCASNGALRLTCTSGEVGLIHTLGALPSRLMDWRLGPGQETFAYGGDEVEVSIWNTEHAFGSRPDGSATSAGSKKRKRAETLFPGEVWRAKNVADDYLGLRQPVHNTCLTYMPSSSSNQSQVLAGTRFGDLRRYDTRSGRRPVSDFKGVGKVGGVKSVESGLLEHEAFISDQGTNLFAFDLRMGRISYSYKGISGAMNSLAAAPSFLASVSLDRFTRIHSTFPPATEVGKQQEERGTVLEKVYMTTIPTVVVWDQSAVGNLHANTKEDECDIWEQMKHIDERDEE